MNLKALVRNRGRSIGRRAGNRGAVLRLCWERSALSPKTVDVIVLGAGMVGVSAALALQERGRTVALVDRHGEAADETSFGNAGMVQSEAVVPYVFPRKPSEIARAALNKDPRAHIRYGSMPSSAPALWRYFLAASPGAKAATANALKPLVFAATAEHRKLSEAAGASDLLRPTGWIKVWRSARGEDAARKDVEELRSYGVKANFLNRAELTELEPAVGEPTLGGRFDKGDAKTLAPSAAGWTVTTEAGALAARDVVISLGPWSNELIRTHGLRLPFFVKRGYHMHYSAKGDASLNRPVLDVEKGYVLAPMKLGLRLTTGAEFAGVEDPASPAHINRIEVFAREMFPIGERKDPAPWLGRRPCLPDLRPIIGPFPGKPGLWLDFGHQHLGFTLGPITGRLLAEMMCGEAPFVDPAPYRADRFS